MEGSMKNNKSLKQLGPNFFFPCLLILVFSTISFGQQVKSNPPSLAILPFSTTGMSGETIQTLETLLRQDLNQTEKYSVIPESQTYEASGEKACSEIRCAVEIGKKLSAQYVVLGSLTQLGEKVIFHYQLIDIQSAQSVFSDEVSAPHLEDMDVVMKRVATSIVSGQPVTQTAKVDNIMEAETETPRRRAARGYWGIDFGYLYPTNGYDDDDRSFTMDLRIGREINQIAVGTLFAGRKGFSANVYASYLFTKTDICPFLGGAFGFHWVNHEKRYDSYVYEDEDNKSTDGFEFTANGGLRLFRTYDFQILLNFDYIVTMNDYNDQAVVFTIGMLR
jgi:TolB-like protein